MFVELNHNAIALSLQVTIVRYPLKTCKGFKCSVWPRVTMQPTSQPSSHAKTVCCKLLLPLSLPSLFYALLGIAQRGVVILLPTEQRADGRREGAPHSIGLPSLLPH